MKNSLFLVLTCYCEKNIKSPWYISFNNNKTNNESNTGIGNILFQLSSSLYYAYLNNANLYVPSLNTLLDIEGLDKKKTIFRNIETKKNEFYDENKIIKLRGNKFYIHSLKFYNNMHIKNYLENIKNFHDFKHEIINYFKPEKTDINYLINKYPILKNKNNLFSLHVRRGKDYNKLFNKNNLKYLENKTFKMLNFMLNKTNIKNCFVLTNDKTYCNKILNNNKKYKNITFFYSNERDFYDIWIISLIKNNIVSNSTLAWWGSYLNINKDKFILYTKYKSPFQYIFNPDWKIID
jgi:hypothetical protein